MGKLPMNIEPRGAFTGQITRSARLVVTPEAAGRFTRVVGRLGKREMGCVPISLLLVRGYCGMPGRQYTGGGGAFTGRDWHPSSVACSRPSVTTAARADYSFVPLAVEDNQDGNLLRGVLFHGRNPSTDPNGPTSTDGLWPGQ